MSRKRTYALAVGTARGMTGAERAHLDECPYCGDEFALFGGLAGPRPVPFKAAASPSTSRSRERWAGIFAVVGMAFTVLNKLLDQLSRPRRISRPDPEPVAAMSAVPAPDLEPEPVAAMSAVPAPDPEPLRRVSGSFSRRL